MTEINFSRKFFSKELFPIFYFFLIFSFISISLSEAEESVTSIRNPDQVILQLKWIHQFNFAGYYAAVEKGYYKEAGLEVTIKEGHPGTNFIDEVVSGRADFGVEMPELLIARNNEKPVVVLAAIFQHSPQIILSRADSGIRSPHNLIGKKVMWRFDSAAELRAMLTNEKVSLAQIEFMELSWDINDLIDGKVDAIHAYVTDQPLSLDKAGIKSAILYPINYGIDFYGDCLFTSEKELSEHPGRVKAFREASLRGWAYAMDNPEELMDIIKEKYETKSTREYMRNEFDHINQLMLPKLVEIGHMNPGRWKHIGDTFVKLGMLDPDYSLDGFLYDPNPQPSFTKVMRTVWILLSVITAISIGAIILFVYNRKLNRDVTERTKHLVTEITERKQVEKNLKASESFLNSVIENIPNMIFIKEAKDLRFVRFNKAGKELLGYSSESLIGKNDYDFFPKEEADFFTAKDQEVLKNKQMFDIPEESIQTKDKGIRTLHTKKIPLLDENGEPLFLLGISEDITEQKRTEQELLKVKKLESVGFLAGGIAHDFNNILAAILGNINLALFDDALNDRTKKLLAEAEKASLRAKDLIQQLLTFAKGGEPVKEASSLENVIKDSANFVLHGDKVACRFDIPADLWLADIDKGQISQVIQNIVLNASHAMPEGGIIKVNCENFSSTEEQYFPLVQEGRFVKITIEDTGIGIPAKIIEKIFDPYFSTKQGGSGLGLAISQSIISKHGGNISVKSKSDDGTTFTIYLPASEQIKTLDQKPEVYGKTSSQAKILIMDDEDMVRSVAKAMLTQLGHDVLLSENGEEAIKLYKEAMNVNNKFNLVIMDLTIPGGMGGKEAVKEILAIDPDAKIIVSSGYSNDPIMANFKKFGFCSSIVKPYRLQKLSRVISQIIG